MKKIVSYLLVVMLIITLGIAMGGVAYAADSISATVKVSPSSLSSSGTVSVTVSIKNNGDPVSNVVLSYPSPTLTDISIGNMATGDTKTHENSSWDISDDMFNKDLTFKVSWTSADGSQQAGNTPSVTIKKEDAKVDVRASASVDATEVEKGGKVKFTFVMENKGNVKVDSAYLIAKPLNGGDELGDRFSLDPGAKNTKTWSPTVNEDITVKPVYTYAINGSQKTIECDPITVKVKASASASPAANALTATIVSDKTQVAAGDNVTFSVLVKNTGAGELKNLVVKDNTGAEVTMSSTTLAAGQAAEGEAVVPVAQTGQYGFTATAVDASGNNVNIQSNLLAITVDEAAAPSASASVDPRKIVKIDVKLVTKLAEPGDLPAEFVVKNLSAGELKNIVVSAVATPVAATDGQSAATDTTPQTITLGTLPSLAAGQEQTVEATLALAQTTSYQFKVSAEMPDGTFVESQTDAAVITVEGKSGGLQMWQIILIIIICAIGGVGGFLAYYIHKNKKGGRGPSGGGRTVGKPRAPYGNGGSGTRPRPQQRYSDREYDDRSYRERAPRQQRPQQQERPRAQMPRETLDERPRQQEPQRRTVRPTDAGKSGGSNTRYGDRNKF